MEHYILILFLNLLTNSRENFTLLAQNKWKQLSSCGGGGKTKQNIYYISSRSLDYQSNFQDALVLKHTFINLVDPQINIIAIYSFIGHNVSQTSAISYIASTSLVCCICIAPVLILVFPFIWTLNPLFFHNSPSSRQ